MLVYLFNKLKPVQQQIFKQFLESSERTSVFHCSRRLGKSYLLCVLSVIFALKKSNSQIRYASVTQKSVRKIVHPIFKEIFDSIPHKYRGKWSTLEGAYIFGNGSMIHTSGVSLGHVDSLRGTATDLALIDEAGFVDDLDYLINSVLMPQLLTVEGSRMIMASSSPISPAHEFCEYILKSKVEGTYHSYDISQGGYPAELIAEFCKEAGGENSTTWRREYLNEIIVDDDYAIIPESKNLTVVNEFPHYVKAYHKYDSMDIGIRDLTVILFAHYDFKRAKICVEREYVVNGPQMTTPIVADSVKRIERELWGTAEPYKRISDNNNLLLLQDLGLLHGCHFIPTSKDSLEAMVNEVRIWVNAGRVEVHESCVTLIESIKYGYWNDQRSDFGRSKTLGHFDALASLMYLIRNIDVTTNPITVKLSFDDHVSAEQELSNKTYNNLKFLTR